MKEILIPLNFSTTPTLYDTQQSFSTSDVASGVLIFTTTADVSGSVASLTIRNASENANRQTVLVDQLDVNSSPFRYAVKMPLPFGQYEGEVLLKKNLTVLSSAKFLFGVNSSLSAEVLPKLVEAYSLDNLVEEVETEVSNLKDAYNLTVSETVKGVNKTESTLQLSENVRYLNEATRKANELLRISQENARVTEEGNRVIADALRETKEGVRQSTFEANEVIRDGVVDAAIEGEMIAQNVATKLTEKEATFAPRMLSLESELAQTDKKTNQVSTFDYYGLVANDISKSSLNHTKINEAFLDIQSKGGGVLFVPTNTYYIDGGFDVPTGVTLCGMNHLTSVIQLVNSTGRYYSAVALHDSSMLKNLTLKDDETNNQQPSSVGYGGQDNPQALIQVIGKNVIIDKCDLYNSSTWCIYADDSSKTIPRRDNFTLSNSSNYWRKRSWYTDVFDVSQVFCVMDNMTFKNNKFYTDSPDFSRTVFDLSGSNITVKGNETTNFVQSLLVNYGLWVTDNLMVVQKYKVKENQFNKCKIGVMLYPSNGYTMKNIEIENNHINVDVTINSDTWDKAGNLVAGVTVEPNYHGTIQDLSIKSNVIEWTYKETILGSLELIAGIGLSNGLSGGFNLQNCDISGNTIKNFPSMGISLGSAAVGTYVTKNIKIHDNILVDNGIHNNNTNGKNPIDMVYIDYYFTHIYLAPNNMDNVDVYNNTIVDTGQTGINGVYAISWSNHHTNYKKIYVGRNTIKTNFGLGTNITRDSTAWGTNTGEPLYPTHSKLFIPDNTPIKYCKNKATDIVNYDAEDIVITQTGLYKADKFGTTGSLDGVTFVSKKNNSIMEVSDGSKLSVGNVITWWTGTLSVIGRISYVKGNLVRLEDGSSVESTTVGETINFYDGLNAIAI
jgi:hypothetical protein